MIITRTPFRISFCGGGSDLPAFYKKNGGCVLSTSIDKYMYLSIHPSFRKEETILKYSKTEIVKDISTIDHLYFKTVLQKLDIHGVEITSTADIPAGTGLGSSSAFTVGLLHALHSYKGKFVSKEQLAQEACEVELSDLGQPIGKQDQYAAAFGGLNYITFNRDGSVFVEPIIMGEHTQKKLEENLMLFYTGSVRSASAILEEQSKNLKQSEEKERSLIEMCKLTKDLCRYLREGRINKMGDVLNEGWRLKRTLASGISNPILEEYYETALKAGATGGKLLGAGGGGFLLFYVPEASQKHVRESLKLPEIPWSFDRQGSTVIYVGIKTHTIK
ncbi:MAG: GHMP kinase [Hungatella sp.]|nr:GHMP kinase [Hungatella sp.]